MRGEPVVWPARGIAGLGSHRRVYSDHGDSFCLPSRRIQPVAIAAAIPARYAGAGRATAGPLGRRCGHEPAGVASAPACVRRLAGGSPAGSRCARGRGSAAGSPRLPSIPTSQHPATAATRRDAARDGAGSSTAPRFAAGRGVLSRGACGREHGNGRCDRHHTDLASTCGGRCHWHHDTPRPALRPTRVRPARPRSAAV